MEGTEEKSKPNLRTIAAGVLTLVVFISAFFMYKSRFMVKPPTDSGNKPAEVIPVKSEVILTLVPGIETYSPNKAGNELSVKMETKGIGVSAAEIVIKFDPSVIQVDDIKPGPFFTDPGVGDPVIVSRNIDNTSGKINFALGFPLGSKYTSAENKVLALISFTTKSTGATELNFVTTGSPHTIISNVDARDVLKEAIGAKVSISTP